MNKFFFSVKISVCAVVLSLIAASPATTQSIHLFTTDTIAYCSREALRDSTRLYTKYINARDEAATQYGYQEKIRDVEDYYLPLIEDNKYYLAKRGCLVIIEKGAQAIILNHFKDDAPAPFSDNQNWSLISASYNVLEVRLPKHNEIWFVINDPGILKLK